MKLGRLQVGLLSGKKPTEQASRYQISVVSLKLLPSDTGEEVLGNNTEPAIPDPGTFLPNVCRDSGKRLLRAAQGT